MLNKIKIYVRSRLIYIYGTIMFLLNENGFKNKDIITEYKNKYEGKRCFIIGNGPSLLGADLDKLKDEVTFASNRIYNIFSETEWRPTFFACFDEGVINNELIQEINDSTFEMKFAWLQGYNFYKILNKPICFLYSRWNRKYLKKPKFSQDLSKFVYTIASVSYVHMQIAVYMGFKEIYLLGFDNTYKCEIDKEGNIITNPDVKSYFGNQGKYEQKSIGSKYETEIAYNAAKKYCDTNGIKIYNATRGGKLEVFERVNFDDINFKEKKYD